MAFCSASLDKAVGDLEEAKTKQKLAENSWTREKENLTTQLAAHADKRKQLATKILALSSSQKVRVSSSRFTLNMFSGSRLLKALPDCATCSSANRRK